MPVFYQAANLFYIIVQVQCSPYRVCFYRAKLASGGVCTNIYISKLKFSHFRTSSLIMREKHMSCLYKHIYITHFKKENKFNFKWIVYAIYCG